MVQRDHTNTLALSGLEILSEEEFYRFCVQNHDLVIERNANGTISIMSPSGFSTSRINSEIILQLGIWAKKNGLGATSDSSGGFTLPDKSVKAPDAAWISFKRLSQVSNDGQRKFAHVCPEFVVELVSPSDVISSAERKMQRWLINGALLGWLIIPEKETVKIYRPQKSVETVKGFDKLLAADEMMPGFELDLRELKALIA